MALKVVLAIAAGGAVGAVARHYLAAHVERLIGSGLPWGILVVNVLGSFVMGLLAELFALHWQASLEVRAFLTVGILGGFTTFSSFALDAVLLIARGQSVAAGAYIAASVALSVLGLVGGMSLARVALS